ncbi:hypothetical protein E8E12_000167 [Didymella heteroderae]|uniref:Uncharacterized protein n=1 Tax=Didymella heteroderae TaxID=1769908 RepID=A0A9P4WHU2_9PLEO|nr:hypothetical protein E8E12_000167 [Didymella heteroderae]
MRRSSEGSPVLDEDAPSTEAEAKLPRFTELSQEPNTERSATSSDSPPSPPSPRLRQLDDDITMVDPDDEPLGLGSPHIRNDMDVDYDIPLRGPEEEAEGHSKLQTPEISPPGRTDMDLIMDLDDDIPVWDPEDEAEGQSGHPTPQSSSSEEMQGDTEIDTKIYGGASLKISTF